jgi:hypothetical protein
LTIQLDLHAVVVEPVRRRGNLPRRGTHQLSMLLPATPASLTAACAVESAGSCSLARFQKSTHFLTITLPLRNCSEFPTRRSTNWPSWARSPPRKSAGTGAFYAIRWPIGSPAKSMRRKRTSNSSLIHTETFEDGFLAKSVANLEESIISAVVNLER